jgi:predicted Co/Zn/Cd cation transporter (cation efflux family)
MNKRFFFHGVLYLSVLFAVGVYFAFNKTGLLLVIGVCLAFLSFMAFFLLLMRKSRNAKHISESLVKNDIGLIVVASFLFLCLLLGFCTGHFVEQPVWTLNVLPLVFILIGTVIQRNQKKTLDNK